MGDSLAVEIAQQAHHQVLFQLAGCMLETERVCYRRCCPRGKFLNFLPLMITSVCKSCRIRISRNKNDFVTLKSSNVLVKPTGRLA